MLKSSERCVGVLMLALIVASAIGCESTPRLRMVKLNLGIERDVKLQDRNVEVHLVGVNEATWEDWNKNPPKEYWKSNNHLRVNAAARGLIHTITAFEPNGPLGPIWVPLDHDIWERWKNSGAMELFIYAQPVAVDGLTGDSQVLKRLPIDSGSYNKGAHVTISIMPSQITVNPPPLPQN